MRIEMLETGTVLVSIEAEDMPEYQLDFSSHSDPAAQKKAVLRVLREVQLSCGMTGRGESYLVEALPGKSGCLLLITVHTAEHKRRVYRVKREHRAAYVFFSADAMLDCMLAGLMPKDYEIYLLRGSYVLLTEQTEAGQRLTEYAVPVRMSRLIVERILEYGKRVYQP